MIQYYTNLVSQVEVVEKKKLNGSQIQKIYSTAFYISISIRTPGKTWWLYLGRGAGHEGVWIHDQSPASILRKRDQFLEYLRKYLISSTFLGLEVDTEDRIIKFKYQKNGKQNNLYLFWKSRQLFFMNEFYLSEKQESEVFLSWLGKVGNHERLDRVEDYFNSIGRGIGINKNATQKDIPGMDMLLLEELKLIENNPQKKIQSFFERKEKNIKEDLRKATQWKRLQNLISNPETKLDLELVLEDQKFKFQPNQNEYEKRNMVYEKIKKLKKGEKILEDRLQDVLSKKSEIKTKDQGVNVLNVVRPVWKKDQITQEKITTTKSETQEIKIISFQNIKFGVGLSARGNDSLRNKWANRDDYWIHLDGQTSAHVVIKQQNQSIIDVDLLERAASILAHFSRFSGEWIPIIYTQIKNLKGVPGIPGMVTYKKEKKLISKRIDIEDLIKDQE